MSLAVTAAIVHATLPGVRILVSSPSTLGHLQPLVPLARALRDAGNDVLWAVPEDGVAEVERRGLPAANVAPPLPIGPVLAMERFPELREIPMEEVPRVMFGKLFGAIAAPAMFDGLRELAGSWRPDIVVCDAAEFAGHVVAAELGVPSVTKGFGVLLPEERVVAASHEVAGLWEACGLEPRPYGGCYDTLYLDPFPPSPQLCMPRGADQFLNASAIVSSGAGLSLGPSEVSGESVRKGIEQLLGDAGFATAARRIADDIAAMPSPADAALAITGLA